MIALVEVEQFKYVWIVFIGLDLETRHLDSEIYHVSFNDS